VKAKYIVLDREHAIIFNDPLSHYEVAKPFTNNGRKVTGAGFVSIEMNEHNIDARPYGRSVSLDMEVDTLHDQEALRESLGFYT
jgi:hypothetical protein